MTNQVDLLNKIFISADPEEKYAPLGIKFNPFPKSGTTNINGSDSLNQSLVPVNDETLAGLMDYLRHSMGENPVDRDDRLLTLTVVGDYGRGKTQLLMFIKSLLTEASKQHRSGRNPYVIYVDNPGVSLLEFIGSIISRIGEENLRKFIWTKIIVHIEQNAEYRTELAKYERQGLLFGNRDANPFAAENLASYKEFLGAFTSSIHTPKERKAFDEAFRRILLRILDSETNNSTISQYFCEFISSDYGVNKAWEALSTGSIKQFNRKEAEIIRYIVRLIKEQNYTDFFILVDEFEDITKGRLTKAQIDNYIYNLRTLLDEHRDWSLVFSMTGEALKRLKSISPPLTDRITNRLIILEALSSDEAQKIVRNYLSMARSQESEEGIYPFAATGIDELNQRVEGNTRRFLKSCFHLVEKASEDFSGDETIDQNFVKKYFLEESII
ncbi:MAG: hypothetical protein ACKVQJ_12895 [Pyrinomonadaceae bacterium]